MDMSQLKQQIADLWCLSYKYAKYSYNFVDFLVIELSLQATAYEHLIILTSPHQALYLITQMDLRERQIIDIHNFFQEESLPLRLPPPHSDVGERYDLQDAFVFNIMEDSLGLFNHQNALPLPNYSNLHEQSVGDHNDIDDTNPLDDLLGNNQLYSQPTSNPIFSALVENQLDEGLGVVEGQGQQLSEESLIQMINYLVQYSNAVDLKQAFGRQFKTHRTSIVCEMLIDKFKKLKKTKEELIKYCMRKAFKFILELPKNKHILDTEKSQKFSYSKSKNRYLKKISEEKSMNNKFLQQIFGDKDFAQDYMMFLQNFQEIMMEDNEKKIKYLAYLLTHQKDGKKRSVEVVKRLPWTSLILQKVRKISMELLKFSKG